MVVGNVVTDMEENELEELVSHFADVADIEMDEAWDLFEQTTDTVEEIGRDDDLVKVDSREDFEEMAATGLLFLAAGRERGNEAPSFEEKWREFSTEMDPFDVGFMYAISFEGDSVAAASKFYEDFNL